MKCGDLVVVEIGGDECLSRELVVDHRHVAAVDVALVHPAAVAGEVLADGGHGQRIAAEQLEIVGDVTGAASEFLSHLRNQERHAEHVHLVGQDVILEAIVEHHDVVIGNRTANQSCHGCRSLVIATTTAKARYSAASSPLPGDRSARSERFRPRSRILARKRPVCERG